MVNKDKRIRIITGHYGSGKSEVAVNYVVQLRKETEDKVALADLDVVNVYFRSRERKEEMKAMGIHPIDSSVDAPSLDLPAVSAEVTTPMNDKSYQYVIDLGGDKVGARVIARFRGSIPDDEYDLFFVVNANRERTQTAEEVMEYIDEIEAASQLKVTGLINNTHMLKATTVEDVLKGQEVSREVSKARNIPIKYVACLREVANQLPDGLEGEILPIDLYMRDNWMM